MHISLFVPEETDINRYQKRMKELGFTLDVATFDEHVPWSGDDPKPSFFSAFTKRFYKAHGESTDVMQFRFDDWQTRKSLFGRHYHKLYSSYRVCIVQNRPDWEDTAEHELLHAAYYIIKVYTGITLESIFNVRDFHEDVVHGRDPRFKEYRYDDIWETLKPYLHQATQKRYRYGYLSAMERLVIKLRAMVANLTAQVEEINAPNPLYEEACDSLGKDLSTTVDDEVACAESVSRIIRTVLPPFPVITGSWTLWDHLRNSRHFEEVAEPQAGDIIICPTGTGNGSIRGHVGIFGKRKRIMSNNSGTGQWGENYDLESWRQRYVVTGGFPLYVYRLKK